MKRQELAGSGRGEAVEAGVGEVGVGDDGYPGAGGRRDCCGRNLWLVRFFLVQANDCARNQRMERCCKK